MELSDILQLVKTELGCYQLIRHCKFPNHQFQCRECGSDNELIKIDPATLMQINPGQPKCADCQHSESLTANTIFHGHRLPLTDLVPVVISVVIERGKSACQVSRMTGLWYSTV